MLRLFVGSELSKGLGWVAMQGWGLQMIRLGALTILAGILAPEDFGLFAFVAAAITILVPVAETGLSSAIVFEKHMERAKLTASLLITLGFGLIGMAGLWAAAILLMLCEVGTEYLPAFFVLAPALPLTVLANTSLAIQRREKRFGLLARTILISEFAGSTAAILLALNGSGVTSLFVRLLLTQAMLGLFGLWHMRNWFAFPDLKAGAALLKQGLPVSASLILLKLRERADELLVGALLGQAILGYYILARRFLEAFDKAVPGVLNNHAWPIYATLRDDPARLKGQMNHTLSLALALSWPGFAVLALASPMWIPLLLGAEWLPMVPVLYALAVIHALGVPLGPLYAVMLSLGFTRQRLFLDVLMTVLSLTIIGLLAPFGLNPMLAGLIMVNLALAPVTLIIARRCLPKSAWPSLAPVFPAALLTSLLVAALWILNGEKPGGPHVSLLIAAGFAATCALLLLALAQKTEKHASGPFNKD